jgi:hypothetical protein
MDEDQCSAVETDLVGGVSDMLRSISQLGVQAVESRVTFLYELMLCRLQNIQRAQSTLSVGPAFRLFRMLLFLLLSVIFTHSLAKEAGQKKPVPQGVTDLADSHILIGNARVDPALPFNSSFLNYTWPKVYWGLPEPNTRLIFHVIHFTLS